MAMYSQRQFIRAIKLKQDGKRIDVLCFIWHNDTENWWEIDYCDKVTKDTIKVNMPVINQRDREGALMKLAEAFANANT